jgi:predicted nucleotidyltransferase
MTEMSSTSRADELLQRLTQAAGANLESVVLYGSAASGDFKAEMSDVNFLCILRDTSFTALKPLMPAMKWWTGRRQPLPLFMTREELERSTDVFAIEFLDMKQRYRVLLGQDMLQDLHVPMGLHRVQVEYELREKLLLLRQRALLTAGRERDLKALLVDSLPSFLTLFHHALIAVGETSPPNKRDAVQQLAERVGFDPAPVHKVLEIRERRSESGKIDIEALFAGYLHVIEQVAAAVDKMLDQDTSSRPVP